MKMKISLSIGILLAATSVFVVFHSHGVVAANSTPAVISSDGGYPLPPGAREQLEMINAQIAKVEAQTLKKLTTFLSPMDQIQTLGKLALFDRSLSVHKNQACSTCHMPQTGYTGASQVLNLTTAAYPGSILGRFSPRKPMSYSYATLAPVLHYNATQNDFYGGNFWDMRATGYRLQSPAAQQAQGPPTNPLEMGLPDSACVAYRIATGKYASLFVQVWGAVIQSISWPANAEQVCTTPAGQGGVGPQLSLSSDDRLRANSVYDQFALSVAAYEASPDVNAFSSKFDAYLAGNVTLTAEEARGLELFNGPAHCNICHLSGVANGASGGTAADMAPLFTDFTSSNLGVPKNMSIPYYYETTPDHYGFIPNPAGMSFLDLGVGGFLSSASVPDAAWASLAPQFDGKMQVPTLRNVDQRPYRGFVKAYMHNGYLKSLKEVVHFYNTRDHRCATPNDPHARRTCWPAPEVSANEDTTVGNLGLSDSDEDDIVAFLRTLTDGFTSTNPAVAAKLQTTIRQMRKGLEQQARAGH